MDDDVDPPLCCTKQNDFIDLRFVPKGKWRHYNGKVVKVLETACDPTTADNNREYVVFSTSNGRWWIRTKDNFLERFEFIGEING